MAEYQDSCVGDLAEQLGMTQSAVSHQLNLLKSNKLVRRRRDGKMMFYTLVDEHVRMVVKKGAEHIRQHNTLRFCSGHPIRTSRPI
ncbi:MAG: helix-turn-helix transcriptional regulator [Lachnospiraceae bacterium]|nr:helix-turn-helix transcriptional regulator [Lachnospiraceae bacterium]